MLTLTFPTPEYEEEFGGVRRYLPDSWTIAADLQGPLRPDSPWTAYGDLRRRRILLDAPPSITADQVGQGRGPRPAPT